MIYVGIDVAKLNHFASVVMSDGEVLVEPFKFSNDFNRMDESTLQHEYSGAAEPPVRCGLSHLSGAC